MKRLLGMLTLAAALGVGLEAIGQEPLERLPAPWRPLAIPRDGVDWDKVNPQDPPWLLEARRALFLERWMHFSERLERYATYAAAIAGVWALLVLVLLATIAWQGRRTK